MMYRYDIRKFRAGSRPLALLGLLLGLVGCPAIAGEGTKAAFDAWFWNRAGAAATTGTVGVGTPGTALVTTSPGAAAPWVTSGNSQFGTPAGAFQAKANMRVPIGGGSALVVGTAGATGSSLGGALLGGAKVIAKRLGPIGIGTAIYEAGLEVGFKLTGETTGLLTVEKQPAYSCGTVGGCAGWHQYSSGSQAGLTGTGYGGWFESWANGGCADLIARLDAINTTAVSCAAPGYSMVDRRIYYNYGGWSWFSAGMSTGTAPQQNFVPATEQEFIDAIAAKSGWPTSSKLGQAVKDSLAEGQAVDVNAPTLTGPATVTGATTTTVSGTQTTTTGTVHNVTYAGDTITYNTVVTTTVYDSATGITNTSTQTTAADKPPNACELNPDLIGCKTLGAPPTDAVPSSSVELTYSPEDLGLGAGSCPTMPSFTTSLGTYTMDLAPFCAQVVSIIKPLVLAAAALMAMFILMPGFRSD